MGRPTIDRQLIKSVLISIICGISLPSADSGSDINLGVRLYVNGHPRWALAVLTPVFANTFFTIFACMEMERGKHGSRWFLYLPLVFAQCYPQFCVVRLLFQLFQGKITLKEFNAARDGNDGGIGCVEPYCESVPQVFIQTAFFAFSFNLTPVINRFCYQDQSKPCLEFDICDDKFFCSMSQWESGYKQYERFLKQKENEKLSSLAFENCIANFTDCIDTCKDNLTSYIQDIDVSNITEYLTSSEDTVHHLSRMFNATDDDIRMIQLNKLIVGEKWLFITTYLLSILAAAYGVSKFFKLGHARIHHKIMSSQFIFAAVSSSVMIVMKGTALAAIVSGHGFYQSSLMEATGLWFLFSMVPTTIVVISISIVYSTFVFYQKFEKLHLRDVAYIILKQPAMILAPHITPFVFVLERFQDIDTKLVDTPATSKVKLLSCLGNFSVSWKFSCLNVVVTQIFLLSIVFWRGYGFISPLSIEGMVFIAIFAISATFVCYAVGKSIKIGSRVICIEHNLENCVECGRKYGFFAENVTPTDICKDHEKAPYKYSSDIKYCRPCQKIKRYVC